jgi:hypothetical protein
LSVFGMSAYASRLWLSLQVGLALGIAVRAKPMLKQLCVRGPRDVALISCLRLCEKKSQGQGAGKMVTYDNCAEQSDSEYAASRQGLISWSSLRWGSHWR